ncbi:hypothetical protein DSM3645_20572 [Blastopirellula marina DSM 3645]|uniref:Uncharacterized protein n=1 Tax=Blastopirellula marina DSM 3645 TaxID=314230 RepID=A3ZQR4_9BACT|nr:hypothetical protein DSM3645_20572 [Blastopirellula marina DSM 3645]
MVIDLSRERMRLNFADAWSISQFTLQDAGVSRELANASLSFQERVQHRSTTRHDLVYPKHDGVLFLTTGLLGTAVEAEEI